MSSGVIGSIDPLPTKARVFSGESFLRGLEGSGDFSNFEALTES